MARMHADELETSVELVRRLLAEQFPQWAGLGVARVEPSGTDNAIFRLGDGLAVRLPRRKGSAGRDDKAQEWLPKLAPLLPLPIPLPVAQGAPGAGYPWHWDVYEWLDGETVGAERLVDVEAAAADLAAFVAALQGIDPTGGPEPGTHNAWRGVPFARRDEQTRDAIPKLAGCIDLGRVTEVWDEALQAPAWDRDPVWLHGDLDVRNWLVRDGRISGVIDFGCLGVGDPACDVMVAWKLHSATARAAFRQALPVDDATWARARGWALSQAVMALSYYTLETNAVLVREAESWLAETLSDARPR